MLVKKLNTQRPLVRQQVIGVMLLTTAKEGVI